MEQQLMTIKFPITFDANNQAISPTFNTVKITEAIMKDGFLIDSNPMYSIDSKNQYITFLIRRDPTSKIKKPSLGKFWAF